MITQHTGLFTVQCNVCDEIIGVFESEEQAKEVLEMMDCVRDHSWDYGPTRPRKEVTVHECLPCKKKRLAKKEK